MKKTIIIICLIFSYAVSVRASGMAGLMENAVKGDSDSQYKVGCLYLGGNNFPVNYSEAVKWLRKSADQGNHSSQRKLGAMYVAGNGVAVDYVRAYAWLSVAGTLGDDSEELKTSLDLLGKCVAPSQLYQARTLSREILEGIRLGNGTIQKKISNSIGMSFVYIRPGSFARNGSTTTHTRGYYMQTSEVTQGQWERIMGNRPWSGKEYVRADKNNPAVYISWNDCKEFIQKLNQKEGTDKYRLPTEAEWEFAARGGSSSAYCFGDNENQLGDYAWYDKNTWGVGEKYAHGVALKRANKYGLYDMHGNVWEWCEDPDGKDLAGNTADKSSGLAKRVHRGGSWYYSASRCRSAIRYSLSPEYRYFSLGFRLSRTL